jgi:hypothetical protein
MIRIKRHSLIAFIGMILAALSVRAHAAPTNFYSDRASFFSAVGTVITDDYTDFGYTFGSPGVVELTDEQMSAVLGETRYESISFPGLNLVGDVFIHGDGTNYCAGCNGNFRLNFDDTSFSRHGGVFGVGIDIVLHTSRHTSIGDVLPGDQSTDGSVLIEFTNGSTQTVEVPADVGFFGPRTYFLGLTDTRGIASITMGTESLNQRHFWTIDNLTVGDRRRGHDAIATPVPEPHTYVLMVVGLAAVVLGGRHRRKTMSRGVLGQCRPPEDRAMCPTCKTAIRHPENQAFVYLG